MPDDTDILGLPLILPGQAQKHVTHNEALTLLDVLVQLAVLDRDRTAPPETASRGDRYLVAPGALAEWAGQEGAIAALTETGWQFIAPRPGWQAHVLAEGQAVVFDGLVWVASSESVVRAARLGLGGASADATNRLALASPATLLTHAGAGHQLKVNKQAAGDTASLLFQTDWSGRAEMGTAGSDAFGVKVSANGTDWATGFSLAPASGKADFPNGITRAGADIYGRDNILGPVAQSAGLPTGSVIERGSSASGSFTRFADGTLICISGALNTPNAATPLGAGFRSADIGWTFPAAFASGSLPVVTGAVDAMAGWLAAGVPTATDVSLRVLALVSSATSLTLRAMAIGRWF